MNDTVLHDHLPHAPWLHPATRRLPGVQPLQVEDWLLRDEAFAGQMALRDRLMAEKESEVHAFLPEAIDAAGECLDLVLEHLSADPEYAINGTTITRPDGVTIALDRSNPLLTIGRLQQADFCLLQDGPTGHVLTGAVLCFPAYWTLAEKIGHPLGRIHVPVESYTDDIEKRVQRLFDAIQPGRVLWRANAHLHEDPALFTPQKEQDKMKSRRPEVGRYLRSERQTLRRLPESGAVVFTIHTYMVPVERLTQEQTAGLDVLA